MKIFYALLLMFSFLACAWMVYRLLYINQRSRKLTERKFRIFEVLIRKLVSNEAVDVTEIRSLAENPSTRYNLFRILERFEKSLLFPAEYLTLEKSAESFLVNWLEFPTELNAAPMEIRLSDKINLPQDPDLEYFVFRFRHDKFSEGWMLGVVGPFGTDSQPYDIPRRIFSRFNRIDTVSPLAEVQWVHQNIAPGQ